MGYIVQHAIIINGPVRGVENMSDIDPNLGKCIGEVRNQVYRIADSYQFGSLVSALVPSITNGEASFLVAPDGSKEGWKTSETGDKMRDEIIAYLESLKYSDGGASFAYAEIQFDDDYGDQKILRHSR